MTDKTNFTKDEWALLLRSPMNAGMAVGASARLLGWSVNCLRRSTGTAMKRRELICRRRQWSLRPKLSGAPSRLVSRKMLQGIR